MRLAWCEILRLPGLVGEYGGHVFSCPPITAHLLGRLSTLPPPDSWVRTPGVDRDRGSDMARRGAGSRGLQLTRGGSTRDQGWCLQEAAETSARRGAAEWCGGARPHTRKWRAGAGSGPGAGASWPPSAAHLLSPGRGQGEEVAAASNMSGQGKKRRDMTDVSPPVSSCHLPPAPCHPVVTGHTVLGQAATCADGWWNECSTDPY